MTPGPGACRHRTPYGPVSPSGWSLRLLLAARPYGSAEALGRANRDRIGIFAPIAGGNASRRLGIEESCPIEVHLEAVLHGLSCNHSKLLQGEDLTPSDIVGILQAKELWTRKVNVIGADSGSQVLKAYNAPLTGNGPEL